MGSLFASLMEFLNIFKENKFIMDEFKDKVSVLLGITGVGKSSFINAITKKKICKVGDGSDSCTQKIVQADVANNGYNYYFVDTPGLDDGEGDQQNIPQLENLKQKYPRINVFIICLKFNEIRLSLSLKNALIKFMEIFPTPSFWDHVLILRTHSERSKNIEYQETTTLLTEEKEKRYLKKHIRRKMPYRVKDL
jgi:predicted GTPase